MTRAWRVVATLIITGTIVAAANAQPPTPSPAPVPAPAPQASQCEAKLAGTEGQLKVVLKHDQNLQQRAQESDVKIASLETQVAELSDKLRAAETRVAGLEAEKNKAAKPAEAKKASP